jgi:hypothetical protein
LSPWPTVGHAAIKYAHQPADWRVQGVEVRRFAIFVPTCNAEIGTCLNWRLIISATHRDWPKPKPKMDVNPDPAD